MFDQLGIAVDAPSSSLELWPHSMLLWSHRNQNSKLKLANGARMEGNSTGVAFSYWTRAVHSTKVSLQITLFVLMASYKIKDLLKHGGSNRKWGITMCQKVANLQFVPPRKKDSTLSRPRPASKINGAPKS